MKNNYKYNPKNDILRYRYCENSGSFQLYIGPSNEDLKWVDISNKKISITNLDNLKKYQHQVYVTCEQMHSEEEIERIKSCGISVIVKKCTLTQEEYDQGL